LTSEDWTHKVVLSIAEVVADKESHLSVWKAAEDLDGYPSRLFECRREICILYEVWVHGMNVFGDVTTSNTGELKGGRVKTTPRLQRLEPPVHPCQLAVGLFRLLVVDEVGGVWRAGQGSAGELGGEVRVPFQETLSVVSIHLPQSHVEDEGECMVKAIRVYAGAKTSVVVAQVFRNHNDVSCDVLNDNQNIGSEALKEEPEECIFTFGSGAYFKLGHGSGDEDELAPRCLERLWQGGLRGVQDVSCGRFHMALLAKETYDVYVWGTTFVSLLMMGDLMCVTDVCD